MKGTCPSDTNFSELCRDVPAPWDRLHIGCNAVCNDQDVCRWCGKHENLWMQCCEHPDSELGAYEVGHPCHGATFSPTLPVQALPPQFLGLARTGKGRQGSGHRQCVVPTGSANNGIDRAEPSPLACPSYNEWPDVKGERTCGGCKALVEMEPYGRRCDVYCESFGQVCVAAEEAGNGDCVVKGENSCSQAFEGTSDMLCTCASPDATSQASSGGSSPGSGSSSTPAPTPAGSASAGTPTPTPTPAPTPTPTATPASTPAPAPTGSTNAGASCTFSSEFHGWFTGSIVQSLSATDASECQQRCCDVDACKLWVFSLGDNVCELKDDDWMIWNPKGGYRAAVKPPASNLTVSAAPEGGYPTVEGFEKPESLEGKRCGTSLGKSEMPGDAPNTILRAWTGSLAGCAQRCNAEPECNFFTYYTPYQSCVTWKSCGPGTQEDTSKTTHWTYKKS